jgi:hypothetical protein
LRERNRVEYTGSRSGAAFEPGAVLGVMLRVMMMVIKVVVVVVATMMRCERRAGKHHQEQ